MSINPQNCSPPSSAGGYYTHRAGVKFVSDIIFGTDLLQLQNRWASGVDMTFDGVKERLPDPARQMDMYCMSSNRPIEQFRSWKACFLLIKQLWAGAPSHLSSLNEHWSKHFLCFLIFYFTIYYLKWHKSIFLQHILTFDKWLCVM